METDEKGQLPFENKYVFDMGNFTLQGVCGRTIVERSLVWNPIREIQMKKSNGQGYFINTSHPRALDESYRHPNCIYGLQIHQFTLQPNTNPNMKLYIISLKNLPKGTQLLLDYHWHLAYDGLWCLDKKCDLCKEGLRLFVKRLK